MKENKQTLAMRKLGMSDAEIAYVGVNDDAQIQQNYAVPLTNNENDFVKFVFAHH